MDLKLVLENTSGNLPTLTYGAYEGSQKIGMAQLRLQESGNSSLPETMKSHVYYEVNPLFQGQGYGTKILELVKDQARANNLAELFLVAFEDNLASNKIIRKNGGEYFSDHVNSEERRMVKYKIIL